MFIETIVFALIVGIITKGRFSNLKNIPFNRIQLFLIALVIQIALNYIPGQDIKWFNLIKGYVYIFSYLLILIGIYLNRNIPGMKLLGMGVFLNFFMITVNGGYMPVRSDNLPLSLLSDRIYCPLPYTNYLLSIGDIIVNIGTFYLIVSAMKNTSYYLKVTYINRKL